MPDAVAGIAPIDSEIIKFVNWEVVFHRVKCPILLLVQKIANLAQVEFLDGSRVEGILGNGHHDARLFAPGG